MKRHLGLVTVTLAALGLAVVSDVRDASAQATDIRPKKPNALMVVDTSGSMASALDGRDDIDCGHSDNSGSPTDNNNDVAKPRWTILAETLTGTIENLECWNDRNGDNNDANHDGSNEYTTSQKRWVPYQSGGCRVAENLENYVQNALNDDPYAWPQHGENDDDEDAVTFCAARRWSGSLTYCQCEEDPYTYASACGAPGQDFNDREECNVDFNGGGGVGTWSQKADGMLDIYSRSIRFGLASFDTLEMLPGHHFWYGGVPFNRQLFDPAYGEPAGCQFAVDGTRCWVDDGWLWGWDDYFGAPQYSYWYTDTTSWLDPNTSPAFADHTITDFPDPPRIQQGTSGSTYRQWRYDIGIRNSRARPSQGRLIGFGPQDWDLTPAGPLNNEYCSTEDECTERHNFMVQQAILGAGNNLQSGTPLASTLKDTYQFIKYDDQSEGVHLPHDESIADRLPAELKGKLGPKTDTYWTSDPKCRETSVILVTDGEPYTDIQERMSDYAFDLFNELKVRTYVIGVGLSQATWSSDGTTKQTIYCDTLTAADLTSGMCERSGALGWKHADDSPYADPLSNAEKSSVRACCELLETANAGGTEKAFYPKTQTEMKQRFSAIFNYLSGGASSRTVPIYGATSAAFTSAAPANAAAVYYELRSSMNVTADNSMWRGNLERVRYQCTGTGFTPAADAIDATAGDLFERNLDDPSPYVRKFFTVNTLDDDSIDGTIRADEFNPNVDNLFGGGQEGDFVRLGGDPSDFSGDDDLVTIQNLASGLDAIGGDNARRLLAMTGASDPTDCDNALGDTDLDVCADRFLRWFGGDPDPDGASDTVAPSRSAQTGSQCVDVNCSPMGAIYRSVPVIVPPPTEADSDDQSYGRARVASGAPSFVGTYGGRPSMVYSQTIDGLLHAFVLSKNDYTSGGTPEFDKPPAAVTGDNNEIWSFVPPAILPELWDQFNQHSRQLDGQMAWANVVYSRDADDINDVDWDYNTVLMGSSGVTTHKKGFYYALDVTDPFAPKFLWQMRTSGKADGKPDKELFGNYVPGAAIATIRFREPSSGDVRNVAVAILPGGTPADPLPTAVTDRRNRNNWLGTHDPRSRIRDWGAATPSRSLTFVELKTGRILARISGEAGDNPPGMSSDVLIDNNNARFDSPISGIPVAYPNGIGQVADRVYVGDIDGTLWRIDLHDPNPKAWTADIAFDAYNYGTAGNATMYDAWVVASSTSTEENDSLQISGGSADDHAVAGQPIQNAPLLSLDEEGNLVVTFSTGDQEAFQSEAAGMVNLLISFPDVLASTQPTNPTGSWPALSKMIRYEARMSVASGSESGLEMAFKDGASVTGPINLFDSQLFFAYFKPGNPSACTFGAGGMCGVNYTDRTTITPRTRLDLDGNSTPGQVTDICTALPDGQVVFGISVNHVPACGPEDPPYNDPWLGGQYKARTTSKNGRYQLVFHTGQGGDSGDPNGQTNIDQIDLPTPQSRTRVRTWVSVVE